MGWATKALLFVSLLIVTNVTGQSEASNDDSETDTTQILPEGVGSCPQEEPFSSAKMQNQPRSYSQSNYIVSSGKNLSRGADYLKYH